MKTLATDRSIMVRSYMKKEHATVEHQFDVWHFAKSVQKKLFNKCKKKEFDLLRKWVPSIINHLWWCCATCNGNVTELREKWCSVQHHITNKHEWVGKLLLVSFICF